MAGAEVVFDLEAETAWLEQLAKDVLKDHDYSADVASKIAADAEQRAMAHFQRPNYKILVLAEVLQPDVGCAKNMARLADPSNDCILEVSCKNENNLVCYILAAALKYT
mmetsp:Transcript_8211/g.20968  ORF Transcript_8211/g.20968 Transcript_8211/m.20968 type:complete len:109 (-) Transcript_8211:203-529(-)